MLNISQYNPKNTSLIPIILLILPFWLNSCGFGGGSSKDLVTIPQDASYVIGIDFRRISQKSEDWQTVINKDFIGGVDSQIDMDMQDAQRYYEIILNSGINFGQKAFLFGSLSDRKEDYFAFTFLLRDASVFKKALLKDNPKLNMQSSEGITYAIQDDVIVGWKGKTALLMGSEATQQKDGALDKFLELFDTPASEALSESNESFNLVNNAGHDYTLWIDQQQVNRLSPEFELGEDADVFTRLLGAASYTTGGLDFEKGKVSTRFKIYLDSEKSKPFQKALQKGVDPKLLNSIPIAQPSLMLVVDTDPTTLYGNVKQEHYMRDFEDQMEGDLRDIGLNMQEVFETLDGDMVLAIGNLYIDKYIRKNFDPEFTLVAGIKDQANFDKIMKKQVDNGDAFNRGDYYTAPNPDGENDFIMIPKSGALYITLSKTIKNDILDGKSKLDAKFQDIAKDKSFLLYTNLNSLMGQVPPPFLSLLPYGRALKNDIIPELDGLWIDFTPVKDGEFNGEFVLSFTDKESNSLVSLVKIFKKLEEVEQLSLAR